MRMKRMLAELDALLILGEGSPDLGDAESVYGTPILAIPLPLTAGFRITRSKHEFNPHVVQPEALTVLKVKSEWLLREGHQISEAAWEDGIEEDTKVLDTMVRPDVLPPLFTPMSAILKPLEGLLRPVSLQPPAKRPRYSPDMALTAAARKRIKNCYWARSQRAEKRAAVKQQLGTGLKAIAIRKGVETQSQASVCKFVGPGATAWTGSCAIVPYPVMKYVAPIIFLFSPSRRPYLYDYITVNSHRL
ncbi:hypothetical protein GG344DRAFT_83769 [Lentinula edodes]|nr:hypothetical protein GG344DRAFT_83769 [Lentinula edodes]